MKKLLGYLQGVLEEIKKISFPSVKETLGLTLLVLVICIILATFTGGLDLGFSSIVRSIIAN